MTMIDTYGIGLSVPFHGATIKVALRNGVTAEMFARTLIQMQLAIIGFASGMEHIPGCPPPAVELEDGQEPDEPRVIMFGDALVGSGEGARHLQIHKVTEYSTANDVLATYQIAREGYRLFLEDDPMTYLPQDLDDWFPSNNGSSQDDPEPEPPQPEQQQQERPLRQSAERVVSGGANNEDHSGNGPAVPGTPATHGKYPTEAPTDKDGNRIPYIPAFDYTQADAIAAQLGNGGKVAVAVGKVKLERLDNGKLAYNIYPAKANGLTAERHEIRLSASKPGDGTQRASFGIYKKLAELAPKVGASHEFPMLAYYKISAKDNGGGWYWNITKIEDVQGENPGVIF